MAVAVAVEPPALYPGGEEAWLDDGDRIELKEAAPAGREEAGEHERELEEWRTQALRSPALFENIVSVKRLEVGRCLN